MIRYARESVEQVLEEIQPLLLEHWAEIAQYADIALSVSYERYRECEAKGQLRIYTARSDGHLIGYGIFQLDFPPHYSASLQAKQDVLYLSPAYRLGRIGWRLIEFGDAQLKADGVQVVYHHQKRAHPVLGLILDRMGYTAAETIWSKRLD